MATNAPGKKNSGWGDFFLGTIERMGNFLPHPVTLFFLFCVATIVISALGARWDWSAIDPRPETAAGRSPDGVIRAVSLLSPDGLRKMSTELVKNFTDFAPLGTVLVALLGVGLAEHSGLLSAAIRAIVLGARREFVTVALVFAGVMSNTASELGYVVLVPLGAAVYHSLGRHPLAGLAAAFAGVSGGYSANLLLGTIDPLLAGLTATAAQSREPGYEVNAACNYYFMFASTFLVTAIGTWVSIAIVEPRLGTFRPEDAEPEVLKNQSLQSLTPREYRGLWAAAGALMMALLLGIYLCWPIGAKAEPNIPSWAAGWPWFGALGVVEEVKKGPVFLNAVVALIFIGFLLPGLAYGWVVGTVRDDKAIIKSMNQSMSSMGSYIVVVFFAAQFVKYFEWSNLGTLLSVKGAEYIERLELSNASVFIGFILICAIVNLLMGSASAKWTFMAPIFVPMMMQLGYSPEMTQCAFRIGDSCTNVISPMMSYFGMIFVLANKYDKNYGMGSIISLMFPYSAFFLISWTLFFYLWVFVFNFPLGPTG